MCRGFEKNNRLRLNSHGSDDVISISSDEDDFDRVNFTNDVHLNRFDIISITSNDENETEVITFDYDGGNPYYNNVITSDSPIIPNDTYWGWTTDEDDEFRDQEPVADVYWGWPHGEVLVEVFTENIGNGHEEMVVDAITDFVYENEPNIDDWMWLFRENANITPEDNGNYANEDGFNSDNWGWLFHENANDAIEDNNINNIITDDMIMDISPPLGQDDDAWLMEQVAEFDAVVEGYFVGNYQERENNEDGTIEWIYYNN